MKKILSVLLTLIITLTSVSQGLFSFAIDNEKELTLYEFAEKLSMLINNYDVEENTATTDKFFSGSQAVDNEEIPLNSFETKRLIVKSQKKIDYRGAVECVSGYNDLYILQYDSILSARNAYNYYKNLNYIEYVEPDIVMSSQIDISSPGDLVPEIILPGDDISASDITEWLSDKIGFNDIKDKLNDRIKDEYVLVAVLDSGADMDHDLLKDRVVESGVNFSGTGIAGSCEDDYGHGTHVAGIIASNTLSNVRIKPYKVLNDMGRGSLSTIATAVDMAVADGADVINMSLTAKGESERMTEAINNAVAKNVNVVVAAGNEGDDLDKYYYTPACVESAITVSATDNENELAHFSNYDGTIDIAALGTSIKSSYLNNAYAIQSGTSMSAPQVTAGLAIIKTVFPELTVGECENRIEEYAIKIFENPGENHFGAGILYLKYILDEKPTTANPVFSIDSCNFSDELEISISCPESDADIYYLASRLGEGEVEDWLKAEKYTGPITVLVDTKIVAIAIADGKNPSGIVSAEYDRVVDIEEDNYEINALGYITAYYGNEINLVVPDSVGGKKVKGIASSAFEYDSRIHSVILPDSATKINSKAFKDCTALISVSGKGITEVASSAFENSSIRTVNFPELNKIGNKAFNKTPEFNELDSDSIIEIGKYAFKESGLQSVNLPNATTLDWSVFSDCEDLVSVSIPKLTELSISVFQNCTSLKTVDMPLLTSIGADAFRNTAIENYFGRYVEKVGNYCFAENTCLAEVILPSVTSSGTNVFKDCTDLQVVVLPAMIELNSNMFYNCTKLKMLYLPSVKTVSSTAFLSSSIEFLKFNCVEEIKSLPDTLNGIVLPGTLTKISASVPETDFIVYGYENTYAQQYAIENNKEFHTVPAVIYETEGQVNPEDDYIVVYALGFNCKYQWYKNDIISNEGGTPIDGANFYYYEPTVEDKAVVYYCVITSYDGTNFNSITTMPIVNAPEYRPADLTEYNEVLEKINAIDRETVDEIILNELDELLTIDVSGITYDSQHVVDTIVTELKYVLDEIENGLSMGDINHDHKISAYDARLILCYVSGSMSFSNQQLRASDMNNDGQVTAIDARIILQNCIEA